MACGVECNGEHAVNRTGACQWETVEEMKYHRIGSSGNKSSTEVWRSLHVAFSQGHRAVPRLKIILGVRVSVAQ